MQFYRDRVMHTSASGSAIMSLASRGQISFFANSSARQTHINRARCTKSLPAHTPVSFHIRRSFFCILLRPAVCVHRRTRVSRLSLYARRVMRTCRRCTDKEGCPTMRLPSGRWMHLAPRRNDLFDIYSRALTLIKTTAGRSPPPLFRLPSYASYFLFFFYLSRLALRRECGLQHIAEVVAM
jgi:hypothetical protein